MTFGDRKKPLRSDPAKTREWQQRSRKPIPRESTRRRSERPTRRKVVAQALARDGGCVARDLVPWITCWGPLDPDERCPRSVYPGGELDIDNVQMLCRRHHDWKTEHRIEAEAIGLYQSSWDRAS